MALMGLINKHKYINKIGTVTKMGISIYEFKDAGK